CTIEGCDRKLAAKGMCATHYARVRKYGSNITPRLHTHGLRETHYGYLCFTMASHPHADSQGTVLVHRAVFMAKWGPGEHACHWCGKVVSTRRLPRLVVDHVDGNKHNNKPSNLVPSCVGCNVHRARAGNPRTWEPQKRVS